jgi:hypothetical protein
MTIRHRDKLNISINEKYLQILVMALANSYWDLRNVWVNIT